MSALVIAWFVLFIVGMFMVAAGASLRDVPEFDWVASIGYACILAAMVVGVLMIFA